MNKALRKFRLKAGLTQVEVAKALGVTQVTVSMWETGLAAPAASRIPAIAALYNCTIDELFQSDDPTDQTA